MILVKPLLLLRTIIVRFKPVFTVSIIFIFLAITVFFDSSTFSVDRPMFCFNESDGIIQIRVNFSHPSNNDITLLIDSQNNTAYSK